jgi:hypothetical protein
VGGAVQKVPIFLFGQPKVGESSKKKRFYDNQNPQMPIKMGIKWEIKKGCPTFWTAPQWTRRLKLSAI